MQTHGLALTLMVDRLDSADEGVTLLRLAKSGDLAAFEQIIRMHERKVLMTALRLLGRLEDAQDAAQEVFLRLHKHLRRFDESREFAPWLYRMTVNVCRDAMRKRHPEISIEDIAPAAKDDLHGRAVLAEQRRLVGEALTHLPEKERAALVLRDLEGLSTSEVARILGSSENTVRSQICSARSKIKNFMERISRRRV